MGAGNSMCGFGGGHNLTLSSSSWGSGSGLWDEYQKKKKRSFPGRCRSSHLDTTNQGRGCPKKLCLRAPWNQPKVPAGASPKTREDMVPSGLWSPGMQALKHKPKDHDAEATGAVRPVSVHSSRRFPYLERSLGGLGGPVTKLPYGRAEGLRWPLTLKQAGQRGGGVRSPSAPPAGGRGVNSGWSGPG